ncbi:acyl-CoA dehydrogenase [Actinomadura sp. WMMB 499]|uniref:acyl-CoA dehydrogenase n=1 Tax=Actinomadura sp. WMMB 499 TaxID=1219491 RepID=UPI00124474F4|nr:acyl-CoA dehydrogenase [Actinomadura sp. WMMB 499]QFG21645.1 acyl-CoA dehydrogenase [Actinomadura sp. WMMB 499]
MGIGLAPEHDELAGSVRGFAERHVGAPSAEGAPPGRPSWWAALAEQGLPGLHLPEEHGGQGGGLLDLAVALEELGRAAAPGPYLPTALAAAVTAAADGGDVRGEVLPRFADGSATGAVALGGGLTAEEDGDGLIVSGVTGPVLGGAMADLLVLPAGRWHVVVPASEVAVTPLRSLDPLRPVARIEADAVRVPRHAVLTGLTEERVRILAAALFAAEACGVAGWCVGTAAEHAGMREQFGRPIGQFQAVKHKCARMLVALEQARASAWDAARALDEGADDAAFAAEVAGVVALDAAVSVAKDCIQVLGGIGYTWEHAAHLYLRRALTLRALAGESADWAARVADREPRPVRIDIAEPAARERIRAGVAELAAIGDRAERWDRMGDTGWAVPHLPEPWGLGATPLEQVLIREELAAAGVSGPRLGLATWLVPSLAIYGTEEQKKEFLAPTLRGRRVWCQLFSEPGAGSDLASLSTRAERVEGGWRLTGQKIWTSGAHRASWGYCLARTDPAAPKHDGISYFLVDMASPGVEVRPLREITGGAMFNEVFLDDVFVPDERVVGEVDRGWGVARNTLGNERVAMGGAPGRGLPELVAAGRARALDRVELGRLVCEGQAVELLGLRSTLKQVLGIKPGGEASVRKLLGMEFAQHVADRLHAWQGPEAAVAEPDEPSGRRAASMLAGRAGTIYGGTTEVQLNIIAERLLGLPRDP